MALCRLAGYPERVVSFFCHQGLCRADPAGQAGAAPVWGGAGRPVWLQRLMVLPGHVPRLV